MKLKHILFSASLIAGATTGFAAYIQPAVTDAKMGRSESGGAESLFVSYTVDRSQWKVPSNTDVILTPVIHFATDSIELNPVVFSGRNSLIAHKRNDDLPKGVALESAKGGEYTFYQTLPYSDRMEHSLLTFRSETRGCRCKEDGSGVLPTTLAVDFAPKTFELVVPEKELMAMEQPVEKVVKTRSLTRSAYVNYQVGKTVLLPDFRNNPIELNAILATIDSVRNDRDLTVNSVNIHGYASPEGSLALNTRLAEGRTESLRRWVDARYGFGKALTTDATPEDWAGLRRWVEASTLANRTAILNIIDSTLGDDEKDAKIKRDYPADYQLLLSQVYPTLRRADYKITYTVKNYTDTETIGKELATNPDRLSYEEMMMLARTYDEGSDRRSELLFEAARLMPDDPRAQLNAAFAALGRGDLGRAKALLSRAGDSPVATYARGVYYLYSGDKQTAATLLRTAASQGVEGAAAALKIAEE